MRRIAIAFVSILFLLAAMPAIGLAAAGDEPSNAIATTIGENPFDSSASMANAADDPSTCGSDFPGPYAATIWLEYTATKADRSLTVDVNSFVSEDGSTDFLAILFVYAHTGSGLDLVGCRAYPATVDFEATAGTTYLFMVGGLSAAVTGEPELSDHGGTGILSIFSFGKGARVFKTEGCSVYDGNGDGYFDPNARLRTVITRNGGNVACEGDGAPNPTGHAVTFSLTGDIQCGVFFGGHLYLADNFYETVSASGHFSARCKHLFLEE